MSRSPSAGSAAFAADQVEKTTVGPMSRRANLASGGNWIGPGPVPR